MGRKRGKPRKHVKSSEESVTKQVQTIDNFETSLESLNLAHKVSVVEDAVLEHNIQIHICKDVLKKIRAYTHLTDDEISGLGTVKLVGNTFVVDSVELIKQTNSTSRTEMDKDALAQMQYKLIKEGRGTEHIRLWWHSHNSMNVFWSGTDDTCCDDMENGAWLVSIETNQKNELIGRVDFYAPVRMTIKGVEVFVVDGEEQTRDKSLVEQCHKDIEEKVETSAYRWLGNTRRAHVLDRQHDSYASRWGTEQEGMSTEYDRVYPEAMHSPKTMDELMGLVTDEKGAYKKKTAEGIIESLFDDYKTHSTKVRKFTDLFDIVWERTYVNGQCFYPMDELRAGFVLSKSAYIDEVSAYLEIMVEDNKDAGK